MYFPPHTHAHTEGLRAAGWICMNVHEVCRLGSRWLMIPGSLRRLRTTLCCVVLLWNSGTECEQPESWGHSNISMTRCHSECFLLTLLHFSVYFSNLWVSKIQVISNPFIPQSVSTIPQLLDLPLPAHRPLITPNQPLSISTCPQTSSLPDHLLCHHSSPASSLFGVLVNNSCF